MNSVRSARSARRFRGATGRRLLWVLGLVAVIGASAYYRSRPPQVETVAPALESVTESIAVTGRAEGVEETDVVSAAPGRVARLLVREGARVEAGEPLAVLENRVETVSVEAATAAVATAQAQLRQASAPTRRSELARVRAEAEQAERSAYARLNAAEQKLLELQRGARPEQIQAAEAALAAAAYQARSAASAVDQVRARLRQAELDVQRQGALLADGAVSQADADRVRTARNEAEAALKSAEDAQRAAESAEREAAARLAELRAGTRPETVEAARAEVAAARAALQGATRIGKAQIETAVIGPRDVDIAVARMRLAEAQRGLDLARARLDHTIVRAPASGLVSDILAYPGSSVSGAAPLLRLVPSFPLEVVADVDEKYLGQLRVGLDAVVTSDAYPGERLQGRVARIGAHVDRDRGSVEVRVRLLKRAAWLRPGQTVSVNIVVWRERTTLTVPLTSVVSSDVAFGTPSSATVYVVEGRFVRRRSVRTGAPGAASIAIIEGIRQSDRVVLNPSAVKPGQQVIPVQTVGRDGP